MEANHVFLKNGVNIKAIWHHCDSFTGVYPTAIVKNNYFFVLCVSFDNTYD